MNGYLMAYITRWQAGEKFGKLAREIGVAWQTLDSRIKGLGFARA